MIRAVKKQGPVPSPCPRTAPCLQLPPLCPTAPLHAQSLCYRHQPNSLAAAWAGGAASFRKKNENELNINLTSRQQQTAGPGWAAVFPASPHFVRHTFIALTLLQKYREGCFNEDFRSIFCYSYTISSPSRLQ